MVELRHLRYFKAVAEELHFGRAAVRLHIAQPALSRQIQQLEEELGVRLLKRTQRSVELTPAGGLYLERVKGILEALAAAQADAVRVDTGEFGRLTVGFIYSSAYGLLPAILERFRHRYPAIELELREMTVPDQIEALARGDIDIGLLRPPVVNPDIEARPLFEEHLCLAVPAGHPLAASTAGPTPLSRLDGEPLIMFSQKHNPFFYNGIADMYEKAGIAMRPVQSATHVHTVVGLVAAGMGIAIVSETARNLHMPGVRFLDLQDGPPPVQVFLGWRRGYDSLPVQSFRRVAMHTIEQMRMGRPASAPAAN